MGIYNFSSWVYSWGVVGIAYLDRKWIFLIISVFILSYVMILINNVNLYQNLWGGKFINSPCYYIEYTKSFLGKESPCDGYLFPLEKHQPDLFYRIMAIPLSFIGSEFFTFEVLLPIFLLLTLVGLMLIIKQLFNKNILIITVIPLFFNPWIIRDIGMSYTRWGALFFLIWGIYFLILLRNRYAGISAFLIFLTASLYTHKLPYLNPEFFNYGILLLPFLAAFLLDKVKIRSLFDVSLMLISCYSIVLIIGFILQTLTGTFNIYGRLWI